MSIKSVFIVVLLGVLLLQPIACNRKVATTPKRTLPPGLFELHLLAEKSKIDATTLEKAGTILREGGPSAELSSALRWFSVMRPDSIKGARDIATQEYQGRVYVLARTDPESSLDQRTGLQTVRFEKEDRGPRFGSIINFELDKAGEAQLEKITKNNIGSYAGTFLNGEMIMCPTIMESIPGGVLSLSGVPDDIEATYQALLKVQN